MSEPTTTEPDQRPDAPHASGSSETDGPTDTNHAAGEQHAAENRENDPPG